MRDKFKKFLFPTEDETFLKNTTLNSDHEYEEQIQDDDSQIPTYTVRDFDEEIHTENEEKHTNGVNVVFNPTSFPETENIAKEIVNGNIVIVNLENMLSLENGSKDAKRMIDFLCGATFAVKGNVKRINDSTFMFSK